MSKYVDTTTVSKPMGDYTVHILVDGEAEWLIAPYLVLIEPNKTREYMYIFQPSLYELGPSVVEDDIGECQICESREKVSPCFRTTGGIDVQSEDLKDYFRTGHVTLCVDCINEFEEFTMDIIPEKYSEHILLEQL